MENICRVCKKDCSNGEERIYCGGPCHASFHAKCVGLTPVPLKLYRQSFNFIYECDECLENPYRMINVTMNKILSFMCIFNERLNRQETNCESIFKHFEALDNKLEKYANESTADTNEATNTVKNGVMTSLKPNEMAKQKDLDPVVLVKPKIIQKCADTRAVIENKNIPVEFAIGCVKNLPKGGIEIKCKSNSDQSKLHKKAIEELGEDYEVIMPKLRNPKIRVTNLSAKRSETDIIECMKKQNECIKDSELRVLRVFDVKYNETYGAIIESDPKSFNILMEKKTVVIGMDTCNVSESLSVLRCYKCCGYNHKSNTCMNKKACLRCGGEHEIKECSAERNECINCKVATKKFGSNIDCNHPAWSRVCTVLQKNIEKEKLRVRYTDDRHKR